MSSPLSLRTPALPVGDRDDLGAHLRQQIRRDRTDVAEALDRDRGAFHVDPEVLGRFARRTIMTPRPVASRRPSEPPISTGLPVTTAVDGVADVHGVGVHEPRHDLLVGVHVGRRHVLVGSDRVDDFRRVAPGERSSSRRDIFGGDRR